MPTHVSKSPCDTPQNIKIKYLCIYIIVKTENMSIKYYVSHWVISATKISVGTKVKSNHISRTRILKGMRWAAWILQQHLIIPLNNAFTLIKPLFTIARLCTRLALKQSGDACCLIFVFVSWSGKQALIIVFYYVSFVSHCFWGSLVLRQFIRLAGLRLKGFSCVYKTNLSWTGSDCSQLWICSVQLHVPQWAVSPTWPWAINALFCGSRAEAHK